LIVAELIKKLSVCYETRRCITVFKRAHHWTLLWASWMQFTPSYLSQ